MANANCSKIITRMRSIKGTITYSNAYVKQKLATYLSRKKGDCSDFTWAFFNDYGYDIGAMANDQAKAGTKVASWTGKKGGGVAAFNKIYKNVKQADIICMDLVGNGRYTHVEVITADKSGNSIGHGSGKGPKEQNLGVSWLLPSAYGFMIRRIMPEVATTTSTYKGSSLVDYLKSVGKSTTFASRRTLAKAHGISKYVGTAAQNTKLLKALRGF